MEIFESFKIRNTIVKNRICVPPMVCYGLGDNHYVSDLNVEHYKSLAKGNPGVIVVEATTIEPDGVLNPSQLGIWDDSFIPGLKRVSDAINFEGCLSIIQIHHAGVVSVSNPKGPVAYEDARQMSKEEVDDIINKFIEACFRAYKAGFKGVEIHGCHSYLLCQFLNKKLNTRNDIYNDGTLLVKKIVEGVRSKVSDDFIIGIRIGGFEPTIEDGISNAQVIDKFDIDYMSVSYGFKTKRDEIYHPVLKDVHYAAMLIKEKVKCPVFVVNSITNKQEVIDVLEHTKCDMACIGRGSLVNPNFPTDILNDKDPGKCLNCKTCMWRVDFTKCPGRKKYRKGLEK